MKKSSFLSVLAGAALLVATAAPVFAGGAQCVWPTGSADGNHPVISGVQTTLKGIVMSNRAGLRYRWRYDDKKSTYSATLPVTDPNDLEAKTIYTGSTNTVITAVLQIFGPTGTNVISSDTYKVVISANNETTKRLISIEEGLWFLHRSLQRYTTEDAHGKVPAAGLSDYDPAIAMIGQAFIDAGFTAAGSLDSPYTETVAQIANFITERLGVIQVGAEDRTSGTMRDGFGVFFKNATARGDEIEYGFGPALKFLATCGYTTENPKAVDEDLNFGGDPGTISVSKWSYQEIAQQLVDWISWAQLDYRGGNDYRTSDSQDLPPAYPPAKTGAPLAPGSVGGWPYFAEGWGFDGIDVTTSGDGTYGDVAISYWTAHGLQGASTKVTLPTNLKSPLLTFTTGRQRADGCFEFGPMANFNLIERAGAGLYLLKFAGAGATPITNAKNCVSNLWNSATSNSYHSSQGHPGLDQVCYDTDNVTEIPCTAHYEAGAGDPLGVWICDRGKTPEGGIDCKWEEIFTPDDINLFAIKTVVDGAALNGLTSTFNNYRFFYRDLLYRNQNKTNGSWNDHGWVDGYTFGTALAVSSLATLTVP